MKDFTDEIKNSLDALLKLESNMAGKKKLFDKDKSICLKVSLFRIPKIRGIRKKYLKLSHSRFGDDPDVCLFVPNKRSDLKYKISRDDSINFTVDYYQDFLAKHKVKGIKTIMPLKQLQCEYAAYELRRKLVDRFDLFLCKTSLLYNPRFMSSLGKFFIQKNKDPLGISFPAYDVPFDENFNLSVERALLSTSFKIKSSSDNYGISIGLLSQPKKHIQENLKLVLHQILNENIIPGGFSNVRGLYLATSSSGPVPLYITSEYPEKIPRPKVKSKQKHVKPVKGEITSLPGKRVIVKPSGEITVEKIKNYKKNLGLKEESDDDLESINEGSEEEEDKDDSVIKHIKNDNQELKKANKRKNEKESEDEEDDEIEERENKLLRHCELTKSENDNDEDNAKEVINPPKKIRKTEKYSKKSNQEMRKEQRNHLERTRLKHSVGK